MSASRLVRLVLSTGQCVTDDQDMMPGSRQWLFCEGELTEIKYCAVTGVGAAGSCSGSHRLGLEGYGNPLQPYEHSELRSGAIRIQAKLGVLNDHSLSLKYGQHAQACWPYCALKRSVEHA